MGSRTFEAFASRTTPIAPALAFISFLTPGSKVLADLLGWPDEMLIYKKLKVIKDRPKPDAFPLAIRRYGIALESPSAFRPACCRIARGNAHL